MATPASSSRVSCHPGPHRLGCCVPSISPEAAAPRASLVRHQGLTRHLLSRKGSSALAGSRLRFRTITASWTGSRFPVGSVWRGKLKASPAHCPCWALGPGLSLRKLERNSFCPGSSPCSSASCSIFRSFSRNKLENETSKYVCPPSRKEGCAEGPQETCSGACTGSPAEWSTGTPLFTGGETETPSPHPSSRRIRDPTSALSAGHSAC